MIQIFVTEEELRILAVRYLGDSEETDQIKYIWNTYLHENMSKDMYFIIFMKDALLSELWKDQDYSPFRASDNSMFLSGWRVLLYFISVWNVPDLP